MSWVPKGTVHSTLLNIRGKLQAIEAIDARTAQFDRYSNAMRKVQDPISDNAVNAGIVLGGRKVLPRTADQPGAGAIPRQRGMVKEIGQAAGVRGHLAIGVAWLAMKLSVRRECLPAGEMVLDKSLPRPVAAKAGDVLDADYRPLGHFEFKFT
jgi:2-oxo-hept-3-ene-1,7-dioate hydratase